MKQPLTLLEQREGPKTQARYQAMKTTSRIGKKRRSISSLTQSKIRPKTTSEIPLTKMEENDRAEFDSVVKKLSGLCPHNQKLAFRLIDQMLTGDKPQADSAINLHQCATLWHELNGALDEMYFIHQSVLHSLENWNLSSVPAEEQLARISYGFYRITSELDLRARRNLDGLWKAVGGGGVTAPAST